MTGAPRPERYGGGKSPLFPAPTQPLSVYVGPVMHARMKPRVHRFSYRVFNILIDLDHLDAAARCSAVFSVNKFNMLSFHTRDHGGPDRGEATLREHADHLFAQAGLPDRPARVLLMCFPRVFGYVFNPISIYFAYDAQGELVGIIYEVRNTFGDLHSYVAPIRSGELDVNGLRQERDKLFYVSPFVGPNMRYRFRIRPPTDDVAVRILETDADGPILSATVHGARRPVTTARLLGLCASLPMLTLKVVLGIHFEAVRLWFKGIRFYHRPTAPPAASSDGAFLSRGSRTFHTRGEAPGSQPLNTVGR
jgi:hypothetical protein